MTIAGAVVIPVDMQNSELLADKLGKLAHLEIQGIGPQGIAVVMEGKNPDHVKSISENITGWQEGLQVELASLNWEET